MMDIPFKYKIYINSGYLDGWERAYGKAECIKLPFKSLHFRLLKSCLACLYCCSLWNFSCFCWFFFFLLILTNKILIPRKITHVDVYFGGVDFVIFLFACFLWMEEGRDKVQTTDCILIDVSTWSFFTYIKQICLL